MKSTDVYIIKYKNNNEINLFSESQGLVCAFIFFWNKYSNYLDFFFMFYIFRSRKIAFIDFINPLPSEAITAVLPFRTT